MFLVREPDAPAIAEGPGGAACEQREAARPSAVWPPRRATVHGAARSVVELAFSFKRADRESRDRPSGIPDFQACNGVATSRSAALQEALALCSSATPLEVLPALSVFLLASSRARSWLERSMALRCALTDAFPEHLRSADRQPSPSILATVSDLPKIPAPRRGASLTGTPRRSGSLRDPVARLHQKQA